MSDSGQLGLLRPAVGDAHLRQGLTHGIERAAHFPLAKPPDTPDAKAVGDGKLARINDISPLTQTIIEGLA